MATQIANDIVNRVGMTFVQRQSTATGASVADVARAFMAVMEIFRLPVIWKDIEALDHQVDGTLQMEMMLNVIRLVKRATRWLLRNRRHQLVPSKLVEEFGQGIELLREAFPQMLRGRAVDQYEALHERYVAAGIDSNLARLVASTHHGYTALGIIQAAQETGAAPMDVAGLYFFIGERLELDWFSGLMLASKVDSEWQALARDTFLEDLDWQQLKLAVGALKHLCEGRDLPACMEC